MPIMPIKIPENPRILVTRTDRIGDLVLTTPVFKAMREKFPGARLAALVSRHFDLRPKGIVQMLDLLRPVYQKTAAYGHFGRVDPDFSWERTDRAEALKGDAGR